MHRGALVRDDRASVNEERRSRPFFAVATRVATSRATSVTVIGKIVTSTREPQQLRDRVFRSMCVHPEWISDEALHVQADATTRPGWNAMIRSMLRAFSDFGGVRPALSIREAMTQVAVPTLFAWGERDSFAPASGHDLAARMRAAVVDVIEDAGHLPQLDQPEALARRIGRFLADGVVRAPLAVRGVVESATMHHARG